MMRDRKSKVHSIAGVAVSAIMIAAVALAAGSSGGSHEGAVARVPPERAAAGITPEESMSRQQALHAWLVAEMPQGVLDVPIGVQLTQDEQASLARKALRGPGPLRIGLVKTLSPMVSIRGFSQEQLSKTGHPVAAGILRATNDGGFVWAAAIVAGDAGGIRVRFKDFSLPPNAEFYFFSTDGEAYGPYRGKGPNGDGDFWSDSVFFPSGVLLLRDVGPAAAKELSRVSFDITAVGYIGHDFVDRLEEQGGGGVCGNPSCVLDANCYDEPAVAAAKDAVAMMEWVSGPWIYSCTGGLIADTDLSSQIPYFLTANHCISKSRDARNLECFFFYQTDICGGSCPDPGTFPKTTGASIKATGRAGDFTLLELSQDPPAGALFLGWDDMPVADDGGLDLYRVSHPDFGAQAFSHHQVDANSSTCAGWPRGERIYSADIEGATAGGSSGSPVVNAAGEVVGQLSGCCGYDCGNVCDSEANRTVDGALAFYFSSVAQFLDPQPCQPVQEVCDNGVDDDCDGLVDCDDGDCAGDPACAGCTSGQRGDPCQTGADCCSGVCKRNGTCR